ncbi:hypothetical protein Tco_0381714, partial [Tanacetum coccineum]
MVDKIEEEPNQEHDKKTWSRLQSWKPTFRKDEPIMPTETILIEEVPLLTRIWSRIHNGGPVVHKDTPIITTESIRTEDVPLLTSFQDDYAGVTPLPTMVHHPAHPDREVTYLVKMLLACYMIMLGYLNWGPTSHSPRQSHPILYWVSIGMLVYMVIAVLGVLRMYNMGGAWTLRASFVSYTISLAAFIGIVVLIVLASLH